MKKMTSSRLCISVASDADHQAIYRLRHDVYAIELEQYEPCPDEMLPDKADINCIYITVFSGDDLLGFVGITPPCSPCFSVDKYLSRDTIPIIFDKNLFEIRALTVKRQHRGFRIANSLMYAAFRFIEAHGGTRILSIGRREVLDMYLRLGFKCLGQSFTCGAVMYDLISAETSDITSCLEQFQPRLDCMKNEIDWNMGISFHAPSDCYHGGAFFDAIGDQFNDLSQADTIINADVLDAWFPPSPSAQQHLLEHLPWIMRTSPPTHANGLEQIIANVRGVDPAAILTGGGSSALIFLAFRHWLTPSSRVLILDPTYGEYIHVLENIVQCKVERFLLNRTDGYLPDPAILADKLSEGFDLFVWVNPNSPTGRYLNKDDVQTVLKASSSCKRVWIDETYIEYAGSENSLESYAGQSKNVIICKSLSKVYALSGMRVAYLCASPLQLESLRRLSPPWSIGLPGQIAASFALQSPDYYARRYQETHTLREQLVYGLRQLGIGEIIPGVANFILFHLPQESDNAEIIVKKCRLRGLYIRDVSGMGSSMGSRAIRIAVKDAMTNQRILEILKEVLH